MSTELIWPSNYITNATSPIIGQRHQLQDNVDPYYLPSVTYYRARVPNKLPSKGNLLPSYLHFNRKWNAAEDADGGNGLALVTEVTAPGLGQ